MNYIEQIADELARISGTSAEDWYFVSRARHGIEIIAKVVAEQKGTGEVITQAFTCATAVNPHISGGLRPVYADIDATTLSASPLEVKKLCNDKTRMIVAQHTLGLRADIDSLRTIADKYKLVLMEDSAHTLGRVAGKSRADVSVHSFGAEKMLSTSFGGAVWVNPDMKDSSLRASLIEVFSKLPAPRPIDTIRYVAYPLLNKLTNRTPFGLKEQVRKILASSGVMVTPILPKETQGKNALTPTKLSSSIAKRVARAIQDLPRVNTIRKDISEIYLTSTSFNKLAVNRNDEYVRYPLLLTESEEAEQIFAHLRASGYTVGKWYRPLFFPGVSDQIYGYKTGSCPVAESASLRILNFPTNISEETAKKLLHEFERTRANRSR